MKLFPSESKKASVKSGPGLYAMPSMLLRFFILSLVAATRTGVAQSAVLPSDWDDGSAWSGLKILAKDVAGLTEQKSIAFSRGVEPKEHYLIFADEGLVPRLMTKIIRGDCGARLELFRTGVPETEARKFHENYVFSYFGKLSRYRMNLTETTGLVPDSKTQECFRVMAKSSQTPLYRISDAVNLILFFLLPIAIGISLGCRLIPGQRAEVEAPALRNR